MKSSNPALKTLEGIDPEPIDRDTEIEQIVENCYQAHNARAFRDASRLFIEMARNDSCVVGLSLGGALVPAGLGQSALIPLMRAHFVDWIVSTGANLYHDLHAPLGFEMKMANGSSDDSCLKKQGIVRIHNIVFDHKALVETDHFLRGFFRDLASTGRSKHFSTSQLCRLLGEKLLEMDASASKRSILAVCAEEGIPVFCPAIADSSMGMNLAALALTDHGITVDTATDVNESSAIIYATKKQGGTTGVIILGGGVAKNFQLQTEPHIQEVLGLSQEGHDFFIQFTDARIDTGGLSGATPSEAVTWGKVNPDALPRTVVCYCDCSIAIPIFTSYILKKMPPRKGKRLVVNLESYLTMLQSDFGKGPMAG